MNPDLEKIRKARLFKRLPDRAFDRIFPQIKVRHFERGEPILNYKEGSEFRSFFGYVVNGRAVFVDPKNQPIGFVVKDEVFLGRSFSLESVRVEQVISGSAATLVVFIPKSVVAALVSASENFSNLLEEIYEAIFERAKLLKSDKAAAASFKEWLNANEREGHTLSNWIASIETKRAQAAKRLAAERANDRIIRLAWVGALAGFCFAALESLFRALHWPISLFGSTGDDFVFEPGSDFNIFLGIIGYVLLLASYGHGFSKWAIRKLKWKVNYQLSARLHILFGFMGFAFIILHCALHVSGMNVAQLALYAMTISILSGFFGQFVANQIPKTIRGENVKLETLREQEEKIQKQIQFLLDSETQYRKSSNLTLKVNRVGLWLWIVFGSLIGYVQRRGAERRLRKAGISPELAKLAGRLIEEEHNLIQRIRLLEVSNSVFKRWMWIHRPIAYLLLVLGTLHVFLVTVLA